MKSWVLLAVCKQGYFLIVCTVLYSYSCLSSDSKKTPRSQKTRNLSKWLPNVQLIKAVSQDALLPEKEQDFRLTRADLESEEQVQGRERTSGQFWNKLTLSRGGGGGQGLRRRQPMIGTAPLRQGPTPSSATKCPGLVADRLFELQSQQDNKQSKRFLRAYCWVTLPGNDQI